MKPRTLRTLIVVLAMLGAVVGRFRTTFDIFIKSQVQSAGASPALARDAGIALLETIGTPVILPTHSQGGGIGFDVTEARPLWSRPW